MKEKKKMLLHSCCGPCSTAVIERLIEEYEVTVFFFNPCITEREEYERRKKNQIFFIEKYNEDNKNLKDFKEVKFIEGDYYPKDYLNVVKGLEEEKEGGKRCEACFKQRLKETAKYAKKAGFQIFTTTLTVSPHKSFDVISNIGKEVEKIENVLYFDGNFKKKAGFQRSIELSKKYELYRQNYCGCIFSKGGREDTICQI